MTTETTPTPHSVMIGLIAAEGPQSFKALRKAVRRLEGYEHLAVAAHAVNQELTFDEGFTYDRETDTWGYNKPEEDELAED